MNEQDYKPFVAELTGVMTFYRQETTKFTVRMWWNICNRFSLEQVKKAFAAHVADPEQGVFAPKPANLIKILEGTRTDNAQTAWGKVLEGMNRVGAYTDVVFDDPIIHAVIQDMGGWPTLCRTETRELGFRQAQFCKSYQAYSTRDDVMHTPFLAGDRSPDEMWARRGIKAPAPTPIGQIERCREVYKLGQSGSSRVHRVEQLIPDGLLLSVEGAA